jgi:alkylation response protein AidB-like acyl-CoA dehydrogenase
MISTLASPASALQQAASLSERLAKFREAQSVDEAQRFPAREFAGLREAGLLSVTLPEHPLAFSEVPTAQQLQLLKLIGRGNLSVGRIYEGHINALFLIHLFGTDAQQERWYADAQHGQHLFGVWNTQAHDGVSIVAQGDGSYVLHGAKTFCSGARQVTRPIVPGKLIDEHGRESGWQMVIVPLDEHPKAPVDPSFWKPLGMHASVSHKIAFSGITLTEDDLLGQPDDYHQQPHFSGGAVRFAAVHLGGAEAIFDATRTYLQQLHRTEDPYQRMRLGEMAILIESGNQWISQAGQQTDHGATSEQIINYANMTRTAIERIGLEVMRLSERCVGARGLLHPQPFARLHADLTTYLRQPAPDIALAQVGQFVGEQTTAAHTLWGDEV